MPCRPAARMQRPFLAPFASRDEGPSVAPNLIVVTIINFFLNRSPVHRLTLHNRFYDWPSRAIAGYFPPANGHMIR